MKQKNPLMYRVSQLVSLLIGARIFMLLLFTFALYVSTFFIINQEETLKQFVFDYKIHGIIFCSLLSIAAGGIINQFYDLEKDRIQKPFVTKLQGFLKQKYFLYSYVLLNLFSLGIAYILSPRIFVFFLVYQFLMWFYSHKVSKFVVLNNLMFVSLTLYPFFGMLVYYQHFSLNLFLMAAFLFLILLVVDILKDFLTLRADVLFDYKTMPIVFGVRNTSTLVAVLLVLTMMVGLGIVMRIQSFNYLTFYFGSSTLVLLLACLRVAHVRLARIPLLLNTLRVWIFIGVLFMLANGIYEKLH